jgi:glycopeptide antibiotics resistance protein
MHKRLVSILIIALYCAFLIKVMVFKDIPMIRLGHLMLNFGGADANGEANFIPFKTILSYLHGNKGLLIAGINLVGNIALLVPIGFLAPFTWPGITWKGAVMLAVLSGLIVELLQVVLRVGIFDIDDVILNGIGVLIGYLVFLLSMRLRVKSTV